MAPKGKIPDRWIPYKACGDVIEGTRIICFKVPINKRVQQNVPEIKKIWDIPAVLAEIPKLSAVIDLTNTARYYDPREFEAANVRHIKILMPGREIPPESKVKEFMDAVDEFLGKDCDSLIGVHCTHGLNRTGYMVCRYMRDRLKIPAEVAISRFEKARGYEIEREIYRASLLDKKLPRPDFDSIDTRRDNNKFLQRQQRNRDISMELYENPILDTHDATVPDNYISILCNTEQKQSKTQRRNKIKRQKKKEIRAKLNLEGQVLPNNRKNNIKTSEENHHKQKEIRDELKEVRDKCEKYGENPRKKKEKRKKPVDWQDDLKKDNDESKECRGKFPKIKKKKIDNS